MSGRILIDPKVCHGQACIKGTRVPVHQILHMLANGDTAGELCRSTRRLRGKISWPCLDYAAELTEEQVIPDEALV